MRALSFANLRRLARPAIGSLAILLALAFISVTIRPTTTTGKNVQVATASPQATFPANAGTLGPIADGSIFCNSPGASRDVTFTVSGVSGTILNVEVNFRLNPRHTWVGDLDVRLIPPTATPTHIIFSRPGVAANQPAGYANDVAGPYTFRDPPPTGNWWTASSLPPVIIPANNYRTSDTSGALTLMTPVFAGLGTAANGTWTLRFRDFCAADVGTVASANLTITSTGDCISCKRLSDFNGDSRNDFGVWRPANGTWYVQYNGVTGGATQQWGQAGDIIVPGDYDGDNIIDYAVWRHGFQAHWFIIYSSGNPTFSNAQSDWGTNGDIPVPKDYDGDGKTDLMVWRSHPYLPPTWYLVGSGTLTGQSFSPPLGKAGDLPIPQDYDGDDKADLATWRPYTGEWIITFSFSGNSVTIPWGIPGDIPVPADYDGDCRADLAVWRPSNGTWYIRLSSGALRTMTFGMCGDQPVPGCYDGDDRTDIAVYRASTGTFYVLNSTTNNVTAQPLGAPGDIPVAGAYILP